MDPTPRTEVLDTYWWFACERQNIFHRRRLQEPPPWTDDQVLREFKFCNSYRASDRVSQYLIREVIYGSRETLTAEDCLLRIIFFRLFSKPATWEMVERQIGGELSRRTFDVEKIGSVLDQSIAEGQSIYTGAFILCANRAYGHPRKHRNHLALLADMFSYKRLPKAAARCRSMEELYELLASWPLIGPFMAYQLAIDINYSELVDFSEDDFTMPGPGAIRGISKCFQDLGDLSKSEVIHWMVDRQEKEFDRLGLEFQDLFGRRLHAIDCQNLFCEVDKVSREKFPELRSNRSRIKTRFRETPAPLNLFYPPKWNLRYEPVSQCRWDAASEEVAPLEVVAPSRSAA